MFNDDVIEKFDCIHHSAIKIYLTMKLLEVLKEREEFTKEEIALVASVSEKTVQRYVRELIEKSIVMSVNGNYKQGIKKSYRIKKFKASKTGFTQLSKPLVKGMIRELESSEIVLYVYLMSEVKSINKTTVSTSQRDIALYTGLTQASVSGITDRLDQKEYIRKKTVVDAQNRKKTTYTLRLN